MEPVRVGMKSENGVYQLDDLFIFTSLLCNLQCSHCYVSSSPKNRTLDELSVEDLRPLLEEAREFGAGSIYFTGGEPFLNRDIIPMIAESLEVAPVTIYTNGTQPLEQKLSDLQGVWMGKKNDVLLRVSLDHYTADVHDREYNRGKGSFERAVNMISAAYRLGLNVAVSTQSDVHGGKMDACVQKEFVDLFAEEGIRLSDVKVLPAIPQGQYAQRHELPYAGPVTSCELSGTDLNKLMCHTSRTVLKYDNKVRIFPCTILVPDRKAVIADFEQYDMGSSLKESFEQSQPLNHPSCREYCVKGRMTCANQ